MFLLCEAATWVSIITFFDAIFSKIGVSNDVKAMDTYFKLNLGIVFGSTASYFFILGPLINVLNHLLLICQSIRNASVFNQFELLKKNIRLEWLD